MRLILGAAIAIVMAGTASAHSFTVALIAGADGAADQMQSAVNGFLVASAENDGHSAETADGHLGGLDVFLIQSLYRYLFFVCINELVHVSKLH